MKRTLPLVALIGFLVYTGGFILVYLFRAFRVGNPVPGEVVQVWHGDPFLRAILVAVLFLIGLVVLVGFVERSRPSRGGSRGLRVRPDLWAWILDRSDDTGETPSEIVDRALGSYRQRLESPPR